MSQITCGSLSITGNFRDNNEDRYLADPQARYFLVADGMGGQAAGEKASELAIEIVSRKLEQLIDFENSPSETVINAIDDAVANANQEIIRLSEADVTYHNMGTTLTFVVVVGGKFYVGGVGDSRVYRLRGGSFEQLTTDHSLTQALVDAGTITADDAANHRYRNVLYRYLGTKEGSTGTEPKQILPKEGDRYILCSDGVTDGLKHGPLQQLLAENESPLEAAQAIVNAAEDGGSRDNITCMVLHVQ
jgi:protein phosphatase